MKTKRTFLHLKPQEIEGFDREMDAIGATSAMKFLLTAATATANIF